MAERDQIVACMLGMSAYAPAWKLQRMIQSRLIAAKRSEPRERLPHVILLVEHPHVYTLGKSGDRAHLLASQEELDRDGASFVQIDRGGDITYHGPGQLVVYPILDLDFFYHDIHRYLRDLEESVIRTCAESGVVGTRVEGRTGVWIQEEGSLSVPAVNHDISSGSARNPARNPARKICAMGIRCSRWVTMHGIGLNVNTDLQRYDQIIPCGITDGDVTSLAKEAEYAPQLRNVSTSLLSHIGDIFDADISILEGDDADTFLRAYLAPDVPPAL
jgi:lipoyl(octanoyl) transferase